MKNPIIVCFFILSSQFVQAQDAYVGLRQFLNTQFMTEFIQLRESSERTLRDFKRKQSRYSSEDVRKVADAYNASAEYFNQVLYNIKADLLNKGKRKFIVLFPDDYSKQVECDLYRAKDFYTANFQKELMEVTGDDGGTSSFLTLLPALFQYGQAAFDIFQRIKDEIKKYNEAILDKYLINEYRFRLWDEVN